MISAFCMDSFPEKKEKNEQQNTQIKIIWLRRRLQLVEGDDGEVSGNKFFNDFSNAKKSKSTVDSGLLLEDLKKKSENFSKDLFLEKTICTWSNWTDYRNSVTKKYNNTTHSTKILETTQALLNEDE